MIFTCTLLCFWGKKIASSFREDPDVSSSTIDRATPWVCLLPFSKGYVKPLNIAPKKVPRLHFVGFSSREAKNTFTKRKMVKSTYHQEFQVPKMEVLNLIRPFWGCVFPYISRIHTAYIGEDSSNLGTSNLWWTYGCLIRGALELFLIGLFLEQDGVGECFSVGEHGKQ